MIYNYVIYKSNGTNNFVCLTFKVLNVRALTVVLFTVLNKQNTHTQNDKTKTETRLNDTLSS